MRRAGSGLKLSRVVRTCALIISLLHPPWNWATRPFFSPVSRRNPYGYHNQYDDLLPLLGAADQMTFKPMVSGQIAPPKVRDGWKSSRFAGNCKTVKLWVELM